jgi:orotate phosphoribosyltransferase
VSMGRALVALRDNPRRRHLLVSGVLGKHIPARPHTILAAAGELADAVGRELEKGGVEPQDAVVIGLAETATALACSVADGIDARLVGHSTRYAPEGHPVDFHFVEPHSHAIGHSILVGVVPPGPVRSFVIVDDEVTSGTTVLNLIQVLAAKDPRAVFVIACLIDARGESEREWFDRRIREAKVQCSVVSVEQLDRASIETAISRAEIEIARGGRAGDFDSNGKARGSITSINVHAVRQSASLGLDRAARAGISGDAVAIATLLASVIRDKVSPQADQILVLGSEEFMYLPLLVASNLDEALPEASIWSSATTRSPGLVLGVESYGLADGIAYTIDLPRESSAKRFAYNLLGSPATRRRFDLIVLLCDDVTTSVASLAPGGLANALAFCASEVLLVQVERTAT